ncbi:CRISPR-associated protein Csd2 [Bacillus thuringiensis]|uniref:CRISPR-associated protein Csd2 n=1 Tax=Bacillus thuringiensis TaxID=1428 RepID=A0AAW4HYU3_BACTU|nr:CRISPR-associated protein Csd2 [Bacillus thuringiensis]
MHTATSVDSIDITSMQITICINSESEKDKGSDTMGMNHRFDLGAHIFYGSIHMQ